MAGCQSRAMLYVRLRDGAGIDQMCRTSILVSLSCWDGKREMVNAFAKCPELEKESVNAEISRLRSFLASKYVIDKIHGQVDEFWLRDSLAFCTNEMSAKNTDLLLPTFRRYISSHLTTQGRQRQFNSLAGILERYVRYESAMKGREKPGEMRLVDVTTETLEDLWNYIRNESSIIAGSPDWLGDVVVKRMPKPRSINTMSDIFKKLRAFFQWCENIGLVSESPFHGFKIQGELYGTPVYLNKEELEHLASFDMGRWKSLARQRDVFVFQCNVGCRVGDLIRLKKSDVENGIISYIPQKTRDDHPQTVSVPLNATALSIVKRYAESGGDRLLPFISPQKYNIAIKKILETAGITRLVTVLDPLSRSGRRIRICDIGSSHMARRTFAGNIYKKVKDPALVASLTGHKEGSRAFSRYRHIDDETKRELVELLE